MLSVLNFDEHLREQVEDMFNINLKGIPAGREPMVFSTAVFKIDRAELAMRKIEQLDCSPKFLLRKTSFTLKIMGSCFQEKR